LREVDIKRLRSIVSFVKWNYWKNEKNLQWCKDTLKNGSEDWKFVGMIEIFHFGFKDEKD